MKIKPNASLTLNKGKLIIKYKYNTTHLYYTLIKWKMNTFIFMVFERNYIKNKIYYLISLFIINLKTVFLVVLIYIMCN